MLISELDYELPEAQIAQEPAADRAGARLYYLGQENPHRTIADLPALIPDGALVVVNDTRVIPARLLGKKEDTGGKAEVFLLSRENKGDSSAWRALGRASKGLRPGMTVAVANLRIRVTGVLGGGTISVHITTIDGQSVEAAIDAHGRIPLPPYIRREDDARDRDRYQTIFAKNDGAVAAPTAGLHLTTSLVEKLRARGVRFAEVTLHVGLGTFQPVTAEDLNDHPMHAEELTVSEACAAEIARARQLKSPVVAIGTTTVRALESAADDAHVGFVRPKSGQTSLLIQPGYAFRVVDALLTNFHLPKSTLLALVSAFGGKERVMKAYEDAVAQRYRFFSYGDAMLLTRAGAFA